MFDWVLNTSLKVFYQELALKQFTKFIGKHLQWSPTAGTFLWMLWNPSELALYRTAVNNCFWKKVIILDHYVKNVQLLSYLWSVFSCIRTEYRKIRTRNNSVFGHFSRSWWVTKCKNFCWNKFPGNIFL